MTPDQLKARLQKISPDSIVEIHDMTGTQDHYQATVVSDSFKGKITIQQHRMVMDLVKAEIDSGEVHALTFKTFTHEQFQRSK